MKSLLLIKIFKDKKTDFSAHWGIKFTILNREITNETNELIHEAFKVCL